MTSRQILTYKISSFWSNSPHIKGGSCNTNLVLNFQFGTNGKSFKLNMHCYHVRFKDVLLTTFVIAHVELKGTRSLQLGSLLAKIEINDYRKFQCILKQNNFGNELGF